MRHKKQIDSFSIETHNNQRIIVVRNNEIIDKINKSNNMKEKRKIVEKYLFDKYVGETLTKEYIDQRFETKTLVIKETGGDIKELTFKRGDDILKSLTLLEQLIEASEYDTEAMSTKEKSKNDYYWYFKISVKVGNQIFNYKLNIGRNRYSGNIALYSVTNYKKNKARRFLVP